MTFEKQYIPINLDLNKQQFLKLAHNKGVQIRHQQFTGGKIHVYLTKNQTKRLQAAHINGNSANLKLTKKALLDMHQHGQGIFSDFLRRLAVYARKGYEIAKPIVTPLIQEVGNHAKRKGQALLVEASNKLRDRAINEIDNASNHLSNRFNGRGIVPLQGAGLTKMKVSTCKTGKKPCRKRKIKIEVNSQVKNIPKNVSQFGLFDQSALHGQGLYGEGIWDDLLSGLKKTAEVGVQSLGVAAPIILDAGIQNLTKRGTKRLNGGALYLPGSR